FAKVKETAIWPGDTTANLHLLENSQCRGRPVGQCLRKILISDLVSSYPPPPLHAPPVSSIPMMDLLVHLAAKSKVNPTGHTLQVLDEETGKSLDYKPSQTVGSLGATTVHIVSKNKKPDWSKAVKANKAAKAFEITHRFTINLPGGQKAVMRISPHLTLEQVFAKVCQDKSLDTRRYTLQHPTNPMAPLNLKATIADSKLSEINLIHAGAASAASDASQSLPDLSRPMAASSQDPGSWYMPGAGEGKKKRGFLSFLKKDKKFKPHEAHYGHEPSFSSSHQMPPAQARKPTTPPTERRTSDVHVAARPKTMYAGTLSTKDSDTVEPAQVKAPPRGGGKKRPAPPPPQVSAAPPSVSVNENDVRASVNAPVAASASGRQTVSGDGATPRESLAVSVKQGAEPAGLSRLHSRNSSDSSGYHELTLSGAESPEASRVPTTFKTSIDTTSIESSDNLNGDSGIQELSPVAESSRLGSTGESHTLPMKSAHGQGRVLQTQTLDRPEKMKPLPSTKKKKAPPPPPKEPKDQEEESESGEAFNLDDILEGVVFDEEPLRTSASTRPKHEPDNQEDDAEDNMVMMETASVLSEDVQIVDDIKSRPCEFIPPPPPDEPPPDECPPVRGSMGEELHFVDKGTVVGDDNTSLAPASLKNSPVAIEGLSLAFQQTIAVGEEALEAEGWQEGDGVYKNEMARFVEQMSRLATTGDGGEVSSNNTSISLPDTESASDTGSVIRHGVPYHVREDSRDSQSSLSSLGKPGDSSSVNGTITGEHRGDEVDSEEYIVPMGPSGLDYSAAVKVSEQETQQKPSQSLDSAPAESSGVFRAEPVSITSAPARQPKLETPVEKVPEKPKPKEEFVLTFEDLSSVSLVPLRPKMYAEPKPSRASSQVVTHPAEVDVIGPVDRSHVHLAYKSNHGHLHAVRGDEPSLDNVADSKYSEVHDTRHPTQTRPTESAPETRPGTSLMPLPSMRITGNTEPMTFSDDDRSSVSSNDHVYRSTAQLVIGGQPHHDDTASLTDEGSDRLGDAGSRRLSTASSNGGVAGNGGLDMDSAREGLQQQYEQLQQQFVIWQKQLQQNQALLATQEEAGADGESSNTLQALQLQMQMQQQMMQQLQLSMQALTLQQKQQLAQQDPAPAPPAPAAPPAAPAPPQAPKVIKSEAVKSKQRPPSKRFEPQLDPREELMIAIRSFGGRAGLNTVPVKSTKWVYNNN
ncbi:hypothetical protein BaRGS_00009345, partial [Batillaria attramentaria]